MSYLEDCGYTAKPKIKTTVIKHWHGPRPHTCQLCNSVFPPEGYFIDGATTRGPWAIMCGYCHIDQGFGLGTGRGQRYDLKTLEKVEG